MNLAEKFKQFAAEQQIRPIDSNGRVLIIDGLNTYIRCFAAISTMNEDGDHCGGVSGCLMSIASTIRMFKPERVVVVFDGKGGSQRRRSLYSEYKSNRKTMVRLNRTYDFKTPEDEETSRKFQLMLLVQLLKCLPVTVIAQDNIEADDTIGYLSSVIVDRGGKVVIMSTDKDFLQLVDDDVIVWSPMKKKIYNSVAVTADYGFHPHNFLMYRALTGDTSDNINGVHGFGEKTVLKFFPELANDDPKDIDYIFESAQTQISAQKKPSVVLQKLLDNRSIIERNITLMRLDKPAMSGQTKVDVLTQFDKPINSLNKFELTKLMTNNKIIHTVGNFEDWLYKSFTTLVRLSATAST